MSKASGRARMVARNENDGANPRPRNDRCVRLREWFGFVEQEKGQGQTRFGKMLGVSQSTISKTETGVQPPDYYNWARITGVSADWLMGYSDEMWSDRLLKLRVHIREVLVNASLSERERLTDPTQCDQSDRIKHIIEIARNKEQTLVTDDLVRALFDIKDDAEYHAKLFKEDGPGMQHTDYELFAKYFDLPVEWFDNGDIGLLTIHDQPYDPYRPVVAKLAARGVTAARLEKYYESLP